MKRSIKFISVIAIIILLVVTLTGCTATETDSNGTVVKSNATNNSNIQEEEGDIGEYHVKIGEYEITKDYSGDPILLVKISFTNNDDEAKAFYTSISNKAYQNDVEIKSPISTYGINNYDWSDSTKEIKPGTTYEFNVAYELSDKKSDVTIELSPFFSLKNSKKVVKTIKIAE